MVELYAHAPEDMKLNEIYKIVPDKDHKGAFNLEKVSSDLSVIMDLPEGLHKVTQVRLCC